MNPSTRFVLVGNPRSALSRRWWVPVGTLCLALALALSLAIAQVRPASAHSVPVSSAPSPGSNQTTAPRSLVMIFSEPPDAALSAIGVFDSRGSSVTTGPAAVLSNAPNALRVGLIALRQGLYTVRWRAVSLVDGHAAAGSFLFGVGASPPAALEAPSPSTADLGTVSLSAIVGRWLLYAGLFMLLGAAFVGNLIFTSPRPRTLPLSALAWLAAAAGLALVVGQQAADAGVLSGQVFGTSIGRAAILRAAPLLVAGIAIAVQGARRSQSVTALGTVGIAAAAALLADAATSHAAASAASHLGGHGSHVDVFIQWVHVTAAGTWLGGLVALLLSLPGLAAGERGRIARRFATSAMFGIAVVASTGVLRAASEIGSLSNLATTDFGRLVVAKSALLLVLAALGAVNHFRNVPRAERYLGPLRRVGSLEVIVAAAVLVLSASLVNVSPPTQISLAPATAQLGGVSQAAAAANR